MLHDTVSPFIAVSALKLNVDAKSGGADVNSTENTKPDAVISLLILMSSVPLNPPPAINAPSYRQRRKLPVPEVHVSTTSCSGHSSPRLGVRVAASTSARTNQKVCQ